MHIDGHMMSWFTVSGWSFRPGTVQQTTHQHPQGHRHKCYQLQEKHHLKQLKTSSNELESQGLPCNGGSLWEECWTD